MKAKRGIPRLLPMANESPTPQTQAPLLPLTRIPGPPVIRQAFQ